MKNIIREQTFNCSKDSSIVERDGQCKSETVNGGFVPF